MEAWKLYERFVARLISEQLSSAYVVSPNAKVTGSISGIRRQIDVLIDYRFDTDNTNRIIIDSKARNRKIDINNVESFRGMMDDVEAKHGYIIATSGFTKGAKVRAEELVSLRILPIEYLKSFSLADWPKCEGKHHCNGYVFWDGFPSLDLTLKNLDSNKLELKQYIHYVGKCDVCYYFHVYCLNCKTTLSFDPNPNHEDFGKQCQCKLPWFWITSVEQDDFNRRSTELHSVYGKELITTVSRMGI